MSLVTIQKSNREAELVVLKSRLEAEGIPCFLKNQYTTQVLNYFPSFEVELQISSEDMERAVQILNSMVAND
jgi:hypothetical protein